jgi:hypothetical protein
MAQGFTHGGQAWADAVVAELSNANPIIRIRTRIGISPYCEKSAGSDRKKQTSAGQHESSKVTEAWILEREIVTGETVMRPTLVGQ